MKKKLLIFSLATVCLLSIAIALTACVKKHEHNYKWIDNGLGAHYQQCLVLGCTEPVINTGLHSYTNGKCVCGKKQSQGDSYTHTHIYQWYDNGTGHYQMCSVSGCLYRVINRGDHNYVNGVCVCCKSNPLEDTSSHTHNYKWVDSGLGTHFQQCSVSGCSKPIVNNALHSYQNETCACGKNQPQGGSTLPSHVHDYKWIPNGTDGHYQHCSVSDCPHPYLNGTQHSYVNGVCVCCKSNPSEDTPYHTHNYQWVDNGSTHRQQCTVSGCSKPIVNTNLHSYVGDAHVCACGKIQPQNGGDGGILPSHTHNYQWVDSGFGKHYQQCSGLGCLEPVINMGDHSYTNGVCVCGRKLPHYHNYQWVDNGDGTHKQHCSSTGCNEPDINIGNHSYTNGLCVCGNDIRPTEKLEYILNSDGASYSVKKGYATDKNIIIADSYNGLPVTTIGDLAFTDTYTKSITIPSSITSISTKAFKHHSSLESITVKSGNAYYHSAGNCLIETRTKTLIAGCKNSVIPTDGSVTSIGESAFYECYFIESINIPSSVISIGEESFYSCSNLESITVESGNPKYHSARNCLIETATKTLILGCENSVIPTDGSVEIIGNYAFYDNSFKSMIIPDSVKSIGNYAFYSCNYMKSITLGNSLTSIGNSAFRNCFELESITIPNSVTSIGENAFEGCIVATKITVGSNVTSIGIRAFNGCHLLESITVESGNTKYHSAGNCLIETATKTLIAGFNKSVIPTDGSVEIIGQYSFYRCSEIKSIVIPDSVKSIGKSAFYECSSLTSITFNGTKEQWQAIDKVSGWNSYTGDYTVTFSDGSTMSKT